MTRGDETLNKFSSRGPTRTSFVDKLGMRHYDNLLKPDLIAPGNKIVGALAGNGNTPNVIAAENPQLEVSGFDAGSNGRLMKLSGTSIAAPAVAGTVALMLQANPALTPGLVKAILQYTAQPLPGLVARSARHRTPQRRRRGARGAIASRPDIANLKPGDRLLAPRQVPCRRHPSIVNGEPVTWSGIITAGGAHVVGGSALLEKYQGIYDTNFIWVRRLITRTKPVDFAGSSGLAAGRSCSAMQARPWFFRRA